MAVIKHQMTGEIITLHHFHLFGRHKIGVDTPLNYKQASHIHASIRWNGVNWVIKDHSKNGTWVDDTRIPPESNTVLTLHAHIKFASRAYPGWAIIEIGPPASILLPLNHQAPVTTLDSCHALPDENTPELSIYISDRGEWVCEDNQQIKPLHDGDMIEYHDKIWRFCCPGIINTTEQIDTSKKLSLQMIQFNFLVSLDEEHVKLTARVTEQNIALGERVHHYLLLILARQRLTDKKTGLDEHNQGWLAMESLSQMLGLDHSHLNLQIFRARKQMVELLPNIHNAAQIIERRVGQVRFTHSAIQINKGYELEQLEVFEELQSP